MNGCEAIADALQKEGVKHVFCVSADDNMQWLSELSKKQIEVIKTRRESGAAEMADGYARVTGEPGVCSVTIGPGLTNAATSLTTARVHQSPVICITSELSPFDIFGAKGDLDQRRFAEVTAGKYVLVRHVETMAADIRSAFKYARSGAGPVVLAIPQDISKGRVELEMDWDYSPSTDLAPACQRTRPDPEMIAKAVEILRKSEKPLILAGRGAYDSGSEEEIRALAKRTGALLGNTLLARGYLMDHPFQASTVGPFASGSIHDLLSESDCVVAVGCSLNTFTMEYGLLFAEAKIIQIDRDAGHIGKLTPVSLGIVGDARATLSAINEELERQHFATRKGYWTDEVKAVLEADRSGKPVTYVEDPDTIDPRQLVAELDRVLPEERVIVTDFGHAQKFISNVVRVSDPSHFLGASDFMSVGMSLYQGIGAAIGRPDRHVVVFAGDGGFMMALEELDTAVRNRIAMTVVIMNNGGFGTGYIFLEAMGKPLDVALYDNPDFASVARALGAEGVTVRNGKDLQVLRTKLGKRDGPVVIDARINPKVIHETFQELFLQWSQKR